MSILHRRCILLVLLFSLSWASLSAVHTYTAQPAADMTNTSLVNNMVGALVGTLTLDPALPVARISFSPPISSSAVQLYYTNANNQLESVTLSGSLYVTYYKTNGSRIGTNLTSQGSLTFSSLDATRPITFHILVRTSDYSNFLTNNVRGWLFWQSPNKFVAMGAQPAFTLLSPSNATYPVLSNQGETTLPTSIVGGGLAGPAGEQTLFIGDPGVSSGILYNYNIADEPVYSISFVDENVYIEDIQQACTAPIPLTNLTLDVENYQNTYLGQSRVNVRFYQAGYPSFRFLHTANPASQLPYTLLVNQSEVPYNMPFSPWPAPMRASNTKQISLKVKQQDLEVALEGNYTTTITVEIISGI